MKLFKKYLSANNKHNVYEICGIKFKIKNNIKYINLSDHNIYIYKKIDIIIPVYNGYEYLDKLFNQIYKNTDLTYKLIVINDNSTDERVEPLLKKYKKIFQDKMLLLNNKQNLGFLKTVNKGLNLTKNDVCILNTDIQLPKNWASRLMYYIFKYDNVASVTPFSNAATIFSFPKIFIDNELEIDFNLTDKWLSSILLDNLPILDFPTGVGFCFGMSRNAINKIGYFDEIFEKGYGEENDWCMRARKEGFKNVLCPNLFVPHNHGGSFNSEEKKILCEKHLKIINTRYPEYLSLVELSSKQKNYIKVRTFAENLYYKNINTLKNS